MKLIINHKFFNELLTILNYSTENVSQMKNKMNVDRSEVTLGPVPRTNEALPTSPLMISDQTTAVNPVIESQRKMRLRVEPKENFRGRTQHEYKPAKAVTRNGRPSKARAPLYVADRFDHHYLDLLVRIFVSIVFFFQRKFVRC